MLSIVFGARVTPSDKHDTKQTFSVEEDPIVEEEAFLQEGALNYIHNGFAISKLKMNFASLTVIKEPAVH